MPKFRTDLRKLTTWCMIFPGFGSCGNWEAAERALVSRQGMIIILFSHKRLIDNTATFYLIGKTSPLSYLVLGHLKTVLTLGGGFIFSIQVLTRGVSLKFPLHFWVVFGIPTWETRSWGVRSRNKRVTKRVVVCVSVPIVLNVTSYSQYPHYTLFTY